MSVTKEMLGILKHTSSRAAGGLYCGEEAELDKLVELGYMECVGRKSFVVEPYYRLTRKGKEYLSDYYLKQREAACDVQD